MYSYRIEQALKAASILHKDQVRKGIVPIPYVSHLYAVAMIAADYTDSEEVIVSALLHDTLEDTDYTPAELGEDFGEKVKNIVAHIPKGSVLTYKQVAQKAGNEKASRAVANIMAANYDPNVPCHRVIRTDGGLGGYNRGGIEVKRTLLQQEGFIQK